HSLEEYMSKPIMKHGTCIICAKDFSRVTGRDRPNTCSEECRKVVISRSSAARRKKWPSCRIYIRECSWCQKPFIGRISTQTKCSAECMRLASLSTQRVADITPCVDCGKDAIRWNKYCFACRYIHRRDAANMQKHIRRARIRDSKTETIRVREMYMRDNHLCGICHQPVDMTLRCPHPLSHSLDHIIPLARGGTHTKENVQLAHLICNTRKSDK